MAAGPEPTGPPAAAAPVDVDEDQVDEKALGDVQEKLLNIQQELNGDGLSEEQIQKMLAESSPAPVPPKLPEDPTARVEAAEKRREDGNGKFKGADLKAAKMDYEMALRLVPAGFGKPEKEGDADLQERAAACRLPVLLNLSLVCLKLEPCQPFRTLELCEEALDIEPDNVKATYRKGKALVEMGEFKEADYELVQACKLAPTDAAIRKDLQALRQRMKDMKKREKEVYESVFDKSKGGFMSQGREAQATEARDQSSGSYEFITDPEKNLFNRSADAPQQAMGKQESGQLEVAVQAWEATITRSAEESDWPVHFAAWLDLARLYMDMNNDTLALRCLTKITEEHEMPAALKLAEALAAPAVKQIRQSALLLRAICLLNEAEQDMPGEVTQCLSRWIDLLDLRQEDEATPGALARLRAAGHGDAAVAHGLLCLVCGGGEPLEAFADALRAPEDSKACFDPERLCVKWNMLGAILANGKRSEDALVAYEQALRLKPHFPRAFNNRAIAMATAGNHAGAALAFAKALRILPEWLAPAVWPQLLKAAADSSVEGLAEAAESRQLERIVELIEAAVPSSAGSSLGSEEVLVQLKLGKTTN